MKKEELNEISYVIRGAIFKVYNELGPGLLESVYEKVLEYELVKAGLISRKQVPVSIVYDNIEFEEGYRIDILVNDAVIIEIKSVAELEKIHYKQLQTYLKLSDKSLGILVNFNSDNISKDIKRVVNNF